MPLSSTDFSGLDCRYDSHYDNDLNNTQLIQNITIDIGFTLICILVVYKYNLNIYIASCRSAD